MKPINLMLPKHRRPTIHKLMQGLKRVANAVWLVIVVIVAGPMLFPFWLLDEVKTKLTQCRNCSRIGGLRKYDPEKYGATYYLCMRCKTRYLNYRGTWQDASAPEYDDKFGKHRNVRPLLRAEKDQKRA